MSHVVVVPGLGVRSYADEPVHALRAAGYQASLLRAPSWRGAPWDLHRYGTLLARDLDAAGRRVDLLVGLSVGTQAAAIAAARTRSVAALLLVSPMVDPIRRSHVRLLHRWLLGPPEVGDPTARQQLPDWSRAGVVRLALGFHSTVVTTPLEWLLPGLRIPVTIVHAGWDRLGTWAWTQQLAAGCGGRAVRLPRQAHSWPVNDSAGFVRLVSRITEGADR